MAESKIINNNCWKNYYNTGTNDDSLLDYVKALVTRVHNETKNNMMGVPYLVRVTYPNSSFHGGGIACKYQNNYSDVWAFIDGGRILFGQYYNGSLDYSKVIV